jgi:hypothetical protein
MKRNRFTPTVCQEACVHVRTVERRACRNHWGRSREHPLPPRQPPDEALRQRLR